MEIKNIQKKLYAVVDLNAIEDNFNSLPKPICCVVKANAYGHGAIELASFYEKRGASYFAVSNIEEAIQLRNHGITKPILILGYTDPLCAKEIIEYNIDQCVFSLDYAKKLNENAKLNNGKIKVHIKIDTGMGRIGFQYHDNHNELDDALSACRLDYLIPYGIFMHFAISDEGINDFTYKQYDNYTKAVKYLEDNGVKFTIHHVSNSGAILDYPAFRLDMVRAGIILYGYNASIYEHKLKPALSLKSVVSHVKVINKGDSVSYGRTYVAKEDTRVATVPIGYADGFYRSNTGSYVIINGEKCKIIGRVCMDQMMVLSNTAKVGDEVTIIGEGITADDIAKYNHTISYEVLCSIGERVPRVYVYNGKIVSIRDNLLK